MPENRNADDDGARIDVTADKPGRWVGVNIAQGERDGDDVLLGVGRGAHSLSFRRHGQRRREVAVVEAAPTTLIVGPRN